MMLHRNLGKTILAAITCAVILYAITPLVALAAEPHEDPETAEQVFSGVSLFRYYSAALDFALKKTPEQVEARLKKMPFANIPQSLAQAADNFASLGISISYLVVDIDEDLSKLRTLVEQSRFEEASPLGDEIRAKLSQADRELKQIEQATVTTGEELKVSSAPAGSDLRGSYDEVLEKINRIGGLLALYNDLLTDLRLGTEGIELLKTVVVQMEELLQSEDVTVEELVELMEELLQSKDVTAEELLELAEELLQSMGVNVEELVQSVEELLQSKDTTVEELVQAVRELLESEDVIVEELFKPTDITLKIHPGVVLVGDYVHFWGALTSNKRPLAEREVDILLDSSRYVTVKTDAYGYYHGRLRVPYWYISELDLQALYYPRDRDRGLYLASLSPVRKLDVLFYEAQLGIAVEDKAYPGLEATVTGRFDYGQSPPPKERNVEIYLDDVLIAEGRAQEVFAQRIKIAPEINLGKHTITISAAARGKYSPVVTSAILNVTRANPILDLNTPTVAMIPGDVGLSGKLYSEAGPLSGASIKMGLGKSGVELVSSEDGTFDTKTRVGMGFGLIGWQELAIRVLPQEPWHAPLNTTSRVLMVNIVNCSVFSAVLVFLGIYLPGRLRRRLGAYPRRAVRPTLVMPPSEPAPAYSQRVTALTSIKESDETSMEPRNRIFHWYRLIVKLIHGITKALLKPQQTLREFATESSRVLGPAAQYFIELTRMVERLLYSQYRPTEDDAGKSKQLSNTIEEELKGEGV